MTVAASPDGISFAMAHDLPSSWDTYTSPAMPSWYIADCRPAHDVKTRSADHNGERNAHLRIVKEEESGGGIVERIEGMFWFLLCGREEEKKSREKEVDSSNKRG